MVITESPDRLTYEIYFNSLKDLENLQVPEINKKSISLTVDRKRSKDWFGPSNEGFNSAGSVYKAVQKGWYEGVKKAENLVKDIKAPQVQSIRRRRVRGDKGDSLDIHAVNSGKLDKAWIRRQKRKTSAPPVLKMALNIAANCETSAKTLYWRGAASVMLTRLLEKAGYMIDISAYCASVSTYADGQYKNSAACFQLKKSGDSLLVNNLMACLGLSGFFRSYGFKALASCNQPMAFNYGSTSPTKPSKLNDFHIDGLEVVKGKETAQTWIKDQIAKIEKGVF